MKNANEKKMNHEINLRLNDPYWSKKMAAQVVQQVQQNKEERKKLYHFFWPAAILSSIMLTMILHLPINKTGPQDEALVKNSNPYEAIINKQIVGTWQSVNGADSVQTFSDEKSATTVTSVMNSDIDQWMDQTLYVSYGN